MPLRAVIAALIVATCWGGNYTATKFAMMDFPPYLALLLRFIGVVAVLAPFALRLPLPKMRDMAFVGLMLIVVQFACVFSALDMGLSITSTVVASQLGVPFALYACRDSVQGLSGAMAQCWLMVAFVGVMIVAGTPNASEHWDGFLLAVLGSLAWAISNIYMKRMAPTPPVVQLLFWPALYAILPLFLLSMSSESHQWHVIESAHWQSWLGIAYSLFFSSLLGYGLWNRLITTYPMSAVVPYSLLVPVVGIAGGVVAFADPITAQVLLGATLTIIGVGVITVRRPQLVEIEQ